MRIRSLVVTGALLGGSAFLSGADARHHDARWVQQQIEVFKKLEHPSWRQVPWAATLVEARQQSQKEKRPLFLFTHDGNMDTGRC